MRLTAALLVALALPISAQSTWYVDVSGNSPGTGTALDPYTSIDFALAQPTTASGDLVLVLPGTYQENVVFNAKGVTVMSTSGAAATVIDAGGAGSAVAFVGTDGSTMRIDGFTLRNGAGTPNGSFVDGGGVFGVGAICQVGRCVIELNDADHGGGLFFEDCVAKVWRTTIRDNTTTDGSPPRGGGLAANDGATLLARCVIEDNLSGTQYAWPGKGGGLSFWGNNAATVVRSVIRGNRAESAGGGIFGSATVVNCRVQDNSGQFGGGVCGTADVFNSLIEGNRADTLDESNNWGGGVQGGAVLIGCTLRDNEAWGSGAAADSATLVGCKLTNNSSYAGEMSLGYSAAGADSSTLVDCEISGNASYGGSVEVSRGGGAGNSNLVDCDVFDNASNLYPFASFTEGGGGGLWNSSASSCRIFDNTTNGWGGGALDCVLQSCEVFGNTAETGGGIVDGTTARCTIYGNTATLGDGLSSLYGATVVDSIFWNNGNEVVPVSGTVNITYSDVQGGWTGTGNIHADPMFWNAAGDDFQLMAGSPCIDAGNPASSPDPDGSRADMGANPFDPGYVGG